MKRLTIIFLAIAFLSPALHSQTINFSSVKVKTKTEKKKYVFPYDQFLMLNYGKVFLDYPSSPIPFRCGGNVLGIQYGQVHIGGWYVSADLSLSSLHFGHFGSLNYNIHTYYNGECVLPHYYDEKMSFNRISVGAGAIVRMVIPLYFYLGAGYLYQNTTVRTIEYGWVEVNDDINYDCRRAHSPHSSGYFECGLQGNIKGFTLRAGYRYNFHNNHELSVGLGWTFGRKSKQSNARTEE